MATTGPKATSCKQTSQFDVCQMFGCNSSNRPEGTGVEHAMRKALMENAGCQQCVPTPLLKMGSTTQKVSQHRVPHLAILTTVGNAPTSKRHSVGRKQRSQSSKSRWIRFRAPWLTCGLNGLKHQPFAKLRAAQRETESMVLKVYYVSLTKKSGLILSTHCSASAQFS